MKIGRMNLAVMIFTIFAFVACETENENEETMISSFNEDESHNEGQNCMNCHNQGGKGEGIFTVAGTVYNAAGTAVYPKATVKLYTGQNGTGSLVKIIEVDKKGNFYTTQPVDFGSGLYVTVTGTGGSVSTMNSAVTTGQCSSCHGSGIGKIGVN